MNFVLAATMAWSLVLSGSFLCYIILILIPYLRYKPRPVGVSADFDWHLLLPCRDESPVISETLRYLRDAFPAAHLWVIDDDSDDETGQIVRNLSFIDSFVHLVERRRPLARTGKGDALNAGYRSLIDYLGADRDPEKVIIGVVDADGRPARNCLDVLAASHIFGDAQVGAAQVEVRMLNRFERRPLPHRGRLVNFAGRNLVRMQDMEFRTTITAIQLTRRISCTAAMGGNGQFTRLAALQDIDRDEGRPWRGSLLEDFELGLHLLLAGWKTEFTLDTWVDQEGLFDFRRFVTQRTRWSQGVMQCLRYLPASWRSTKLTTLGVVEITYYLFQPWVQILGTVIYSVPIGYFFYAVATDPGAKSLLYSNAGIALLLLYLITGVGQFALWGPVYWWRCERKSGFWKGLGWGLGYTLYVVIFYITCCRAALRIAMGRHGWAKTRRNAERQVAGPVAKEY